MTASQAMLTTAEVAARCRVTGDTVRRWVTEGKLVPAGRTPGGQHRYTVDQVEALLAPAAPRLELGPEAARVEAALLAAEGMLVRVRRGGRAS